MYRNDNPKPALRIEWVIYSDQPCVTAFMRFHTKAQHFEDSLDEFSVVSLILEILRFTHKNSTQYAWCNYFYRVVNGDDMNFYILTLHLVFYPLQDLEIPYRSK